MYCMICKAIFLRVFRKPILMQNKPALCQRKSPVEPQDEVTLQLLDPFTPEGLYVGQEDRPPCPCSLGLARLLRCPNPQIDETTGDSTRFGLKISDQISSRRRTRFTDQVMAGVLELHSTSSQSRFHFLSLSRNRTLEGTLDGSNDQYLCLEGPSREEVASTLGNVGGPQRLFFPFGLALACAHTTYSVMVG